MKKKTALFLWITLSITLLAAAGILFLNLQKSPNEALAQDKKSISVVLDDNYPPYVFRDSNGELEGILVDQWALWSEETGVKANLYAMDWADALAGMQAGEYDVIDTVFVNEERKTWLDFSVPYATIDVPIYHSNKIGGITEAVRRARRMASHMLKIEVEVDSLAQLEVALPHRPDVIMLDNFSLEDLAKAVAMTAGAVTLEASGGVNLQTVGGIARTGVQVISVGALTHSASVLDIGLDAV